MNASSVRSYVISREWAMDPGHLMSTAAAVSAAMEKFSPEALSAARAKAAQTKMPQAGYSVQDGVAHIAISGVLLKEVPCIFELMGVQATSYVDTCAALAAAIADDGVDSICLDVDSPGGSVSGVQALGDAVFAARGKKPIVAHVSDLCASAAYWVASQADKVLASDSALVGSIGVYAVMEDSSAASAADGIKVHVLRSHELKGAGVDGSPITNAQINDGQRVVDQIADMFVGTVARGRGLSGATVKESATGQVWLASQAKDRGLVDQIASPAQAHADAVRGRGRNPNSVLSSVPKGTKEKAMSQVAIEEAAAQLAAKDAQLAAKDAEVVAMRAQAKAIEGSRRDDLIEKYRDRVQPSALESIKGFGEHCGGDLGKFEKFLKDMPVVTRVARESAAPVLELVPQPASGVASIVGVDNFGTATGGEAGAKQVGRWLGGMPAKKIDAFAKVRSFRNDGSFELVDGSIVTKAELQKMVTA